MKILFISLGCDEKSCRYGSDAGSAGIERIRDDGRRDTGRCDCDKYLLFYP